MLIFLLVVAVQCNLSGQPYWMMTDDAPDPRDVFWRNVGADRLTIESRKILVQCVLLLGILAWGTIATYINRFTLKTLGSIPLGLSPSVVQGKPIQIRIHVTTEPLLELTPSYSDCPFSGYLPALVVSLILLWLPNLFFMLGTASSLLQLSNVLISFLISLQLASPQHLDSNASHSLQIVCTSRQFCILLWNT